jgi:hypothetical protein
MSTYKASDQMWLSDSLNWEKTSNLATADWTLTSFLFQSSFINQHFIIDSISKFSHLDAILIYTNSKASTIQTLYTSFMNDLIIQTNTCFLPLSPLLQSEYQEVFSTTLIIAPELSIMFNDYLTSYFLASSFNNTPAAVFDSYINNLNYYPSEGIIHFMLFFLYAWFLVYFFTSTISLKWSTPLGVYFLRFYYYFYSISRETRIQLEAVFQTFVFFLLYWIVVLMTFDDDQEEIIEFIDSSFFYFFSILVSYLCYKYSIHYFAFLDASENKSRSVSFISQQFMKDALNSFALFLRFYILLFRVNVYDILDDFFDSFYIFVGDFDDDEYLNELFLSIHGTILFTLDNQDDRSFLLEDENDFSNDLFYTYFVVWGKLFFFIFFMSEEAARLGLAFYICYLIIFEVHAVNCSYKEDNFFLNKKLSNI